MMVSFCAVLFPHEILALNQFLRIFLPTLNMLKKQVIMSLQRSKALFPARGLKSIELSQWYKSI